MLNLPGTDPANQREDQAACLNISTENIIKERKNKERKEKARKQSYKITHHSITRKLALLIKKIQTGPLHQVYATLRATQDITDLNLPENKPSTVSTGTNIHLGSHSEPPGRESIKLPPRINFKNCHLGSLANLHQGAQVTAYHPVTHTDFPRRTLINFHQRRIKLMSTQNKKQKQ